MAQEPQPALEKAVEKPTSLTAKVTDEAAIVPSLNRALTSEGRPSHLTARGILAPSFSASTFSRSYSVPQGFLVGGRI